MLVSPAPLVGEEHGAYEGLHLHQHLRIAFPHHQTLPRGPRRLATEVTEADDGSAAANAALDDSMVVGGKQSGLFEWRKPEKTMEMDTRTKRKVRRQ